LLESVHIKMIDLGIWRWRALSGNPWNIAVEYNNDVGFRDRFLHAVAQAEPGGMDRRETHVGASRIEDTKARDGRCKRGQSRWNGMIAAGVASDEKWRLGVDEIVGDEADLCWGQTAECDGCPVRLVQGVWLNLLLHCFAGADKIYRTARF
jgi:hypothetical protein